jgi:uncharacterized protein YyaL (SSP411 family)
VNPASAFQPWGTEAFEQARREGKPVLLLVSDGPSSACRERERRAFDGSEARDLLALQFVAVRVDRVDRPDVADVYASAAALLGDETGSEWPLLVLLTPDGRPFYATFGRDDGAFPRALAATLARLAGEYRENRAAFETKAGLLTARLREAQSGAASSRPLGQELVARALSGLREAFDAGHGGFGVLPRRPPHAALRFLLSEHERSGSADALRLAGRTLEAMARGGIRDHVGGGFHHEAADAGWGQPRFEKRLDDNALLLAAYARAHAATGEPVFAEAASGIAAWALRELRDPEGGFRFALEAGEDGGHFYLWERTEIEAALGGGPGRDFLQIYRLDPPGVLSQAGPAVAGPARALQTLSARRDARPHPPFDERIVAGANGLMIGALARSGALLGRAEYIEAARAAAAKTLERLGPAGSLKHAVRGADAAGPAFLEDYAELADGLLDLHEAGKEARWRSDAVALVESATGRFLDASGGGFFATEPAHGPLLVRLKDGYDGERPCANGVMASVLLRLGRLTGEKRYAELGRRTVEVFRADLERAPRGMETLAAVTGELLGPPAAASRTEAPLKAREVRGPVTVEAALSSSVAHPGELLEARVTLTIDKGWSVSAHRPLARDLVPFTVSLLDDQLTAQPPRYPEGIAVKGGLTREPIGAVYFDAAAVVIPLRVPARAEPGVTRLRLRARYQPCDERDCRSPEAVTLELPLSVAAR